ncbi:HNH endonuclease, partial [Escherichia coli]
GYLQIKVYGKKYSAHRIVAKAFCTGFCDGLVVNHKNGRRDDNRADNLEWVSHSENSKHGYKQNGRIPISLGKFSGDHPASKAVISTDMKTGEEVYYEAAMDAVREGFDSSSISRCCNGESSYHKGRFWRFANEKMKARWGDRAA